eukprot:PhF_6_TR11159/c0_g1_i1/m.17985/K21970/NSUN4; 5-methylcytosine rRNA methyltransferase NSUN4
MSKPKGKLTKNSSPPTKGVNAFHSYFESVYGKERWATLYPALQTEGAKCALRNKYCSLPIESWRTADMIPITDLQPLEVYGSASKSALPPPPRDGRGIAAYYLLDAPSCAAVLALDLVANQNVLDLCAAPGGKSVGIAQIITSVGSLTSNEFNSQRRKRLQGVIREYIGFEFYNKVIIGERDAMRWHAPGKYDRVLLDAPCSADRHVISNQELEHWSLASTTEYAQNQQRMLLQALETARCDGGKVVYSTCSISPLENDGVVKHVLEKSRVEAIVLSLKVGPAVPPMSDSVEFTEYGWLYLPDRNGAGHGPLYVCVLQVTGKSKASLAPTEYELEESEESGEES